MAHVYRTWKPGASWCLPEKVRSRYQTFTIIVFQISQIHSMPMINHLGCAPGLCKQFPYPGVRSVNMNDVPAFQHSKKLSLAITDQRLKVHLVFPFRMPG